MWAPSFAIHGECGKTSHVRLTQTVLWASTIILYLTAWATRLSSIHTLSLSLACKVVPFIYKRGCTLSQQRIDRSTTLQRLSSNSNNQRSIHPLLVLDTLKLHRVHARILSAGKSSRHSRHFGPESDRTSCTPILLSSVCNSTANFEHLGSGIKSPTDLNWTRARCLNQYKPYVIEC